MVEVCNEFGSVRLFIYLIVRSFPTHNLKICSLVFLSFCMKLGIHKFKKMVMTNLKKKKKNSNWVRRAQKIPKMEQSRGFWSLDKNLIQSYILFYLNIKLLMVF